MEMQNEGARPMTITLVADQWSTVLWLLNEAPAPHRVSNPLIVALMQQLRAQAQRQTTEAMLGQLGDIGGSPSLDG